MHDFFDLRTRVHQSFGIFRYSDILAECGVIAPAAQILQVGYFLDSVLRSAGDLPDVNDDMALGSWMRRALSGTVPLRSEPTARLSELRERVSTVLEWDSSGDFAELLNYRCGAKAYASATAKLRSRGLQSTLVDVLGITEHFQLSVLPKAVKAFDLIKGQGHEEAWLTTVFYRHALRSLLADRANRSHLEAFSEYSVIEEPVAPAWTEIDTTEIVSAVQQFPPIENAALRLYFGFDGPERTLAEIGAEIGHSEYKARSAIVRGLGRLAVQLGLQGVFDQREAAILRLTLVDGASLANAAKVLGISYTEARRIYAQIGQGFRRGLRTRTVSRSVNELPHEEELK